MSPEMNKDEDRPNETWPDKEFLENVLRKWLGDPNIRVSEFTSRIATNKGDNYTSDMFRVTIRCEQRNDPMTVIIKRLLSTGPVGESITKSSAFLREEQMVSSVLPEMYSVLKKVLPDLEPFGPGYVYSTPGVLVMEDLQLGGFRMAQRRLGLDMNHCSLVLRTLARYHAASVLLLERKSLDFSIFQKFLFMEENVRSDMENMFNGMLRPLSEELQSFKGLEKYSARISNLVNQNFLLVVERAVEVQEGEDFIVLSHGDLWVNNILFRYSNCGELDGVRFVDFPLPSITSPSIDLQYFLTSSTNETVRTTCLDQLLEEYHEVLCETMAALECSTRPPTFEKLNEDFHKRSAYGMYSVANVLPVALAEPGQFDMNVVIDTGRTQNELFRSDSYRKALEWFLPLYESKGFF